MNFNVRGVLPWIASNPYPVAVIGAGPVGLAAAAHLLARGFETLVLEAGARSALIRAWTHVHMFSPWPVQHRPGAAANSSSPTAESPPPDVYPTGGDLLARNPEPLAAPPELASRTSVLEARVTRYRGGLRHDEGRPGEGALRALARPR